MAKFFQPMPIIEYNSTLCKNITQRTLLTRKIREGYASFYERTLQDGERPDVVAYKEYGDQFFDWLCYYSNEIVDPYHGWVLSEDNFNKYIISKYGSLAEAVERTAYYRVTSSDENISVSAYNALTSLRKKYWRPFLDEADNILYYVRVKSDLKVATNAFVRLTASLNETATVKFAIGEHVTQTIGGAVTASGDVVRITATTLELQHIQGTFVAGSVVGMSSDTTASIGGVLDIGYCIPTDEAVYWEPVSYFTHEQELNEQKRKIKMLLPAIASQAVRSHEDLLNELV